MKTLIVGRYVKIIKGTLFNKTGKLVGYDSEEGEVVIQVDQETFVHTNVDYITQVWIDWIIGNVNESYGNVGGKYFGNVCVKKDSVLFTDNNENGIDYENEDIPADLLEIARKEQQRYI